MEFNEEKAIEIAKKNGLDLKTVKVWKTRGAIPKKYLIERGTKQDILLLKKLFDAYYIKQTNVMSFSYYEWQKIITKEELPRLERMNEFKREILQLKSCIKENLSKLKDSKDSFKKRAIIALMKHPTLQLTGRVNSKKICNIRLVEQARNNTDLDPQMLKELIENLQVVLNDLVI